jgi:uncharacterized protein (TIGR03032 family)
VTGESAAASGSSSPPSTPRRIVSNHSPSFARLLGDLRISLLVSTYQAGKLAVVQARGDDLFITYHNFDRPMGIAVSAEQIALGTTNQIWFMVSSPQIPRFAGPEFDSAYLARGSHFTGDMHVHEMEWSGRELWVVNTLFSCLCTIGGAHSFIPRWKPRFVSAPAAEDRCHLNGLALEEGRPRYVTCLGATDSPRGWQSNRVAGGCLIDVPSGITILQGLSMPHSPRVHEGHVWFLESGTGLLQRVEPGQGVVRVAELPGYPRGLSFHGPYAFIGISKMRPSSSNEGLPIARSPGDLKCGVAAVELASGQVVGLVEFTAGIEEVFDVRVNPSARSPVFSGPDARNDGTPPIWVIPPARL